MWPVTWSGAVLLFAAGILGGLTGSIAGLASVATYPALLFVGLPPVAANVTNTVAMVFNGVGSIAGSRPELAGQGDWLKRILPFATLAGIVGAVLLLSTPAEGFEKVVPALIAFASVAILIPVRPKDDARVASDRRHTVMMLLEGAAIFAICIYGGYFGAAAGVLLLALLLRAGGATLAERQREQERHPRDREHRRRGHLRGGGPGALARCGALGLGSLLGCRLGPVIVRHSPAGPLRVVIGVAGLALAAKLGWDAYR